MTIYIGSHSHLISAINLSDGTEVWTVELPDRIESSAASNDSAEKIFIGCYDGSLYCLCANDGHILWKFQTGNAIKCSPLCIGTPINFYWGNVIDLVIVTNLLLNCYAINFLCHPISV